MKEHEIQLRNIYSTYATLREDGDNAGVQSAGRWETLARSPNGGGAFGKAEFMTMLLNFQVIEILCLREPHMP